MRVGRCGLLILGLAFAGSASSADSEDAYDNRCCWKGMPGEPDDNACSGDAFCAGPGAGFWHMLHCRKHCLLSGKA